MATFSEIINDSRPVLVDFSAEWCGPCQMLAPQLKQLAGMVGNDVRIVKIDVDKNQNLSAQYRIQGVPTLMLFQNGEMLWRQSGYQTAGQLKQVIDQHRAA